MGIEVGKSSFHSCPICGCQSTGPRIEYKGRSDLFKGLALVSCINCGMAYIDPMPSQAELTVYNDAYFVNAHGGSDFAYSPFFSALAKIRIKHIEDYTTSENISVGSVLEYGPGRGALAAEWLRIKPYDDYRVVESDKASLAHLRSLGVKSLDESRSSVECSKKGSPTSFIGLDFDLIIMSHVLEHVSDPKKFLHEALQKLKPGGVLFIEVPCQDYLFKEIWEPHLLFFDKPQLNRLLDDLGLDSVSVTYHGRTIDAEKRRIFFDDLLDRMRGVLMHLRVLPAMPWEKGLQFIHSVEERASVFSFYAHKENSLPSIWLRAVATKPIR